MKTSMLEDRKVVAGGGALVALVVVALAWFLAISPRFDRADELATQNADVEMQNSVLIGKNAELARQDEQIGQVEQARDTALASLPAAASFPSFTRELQSQAEAAGVDLQNIEISEPVAVVAEGAGPTDGSAAPAAPEVAPEAQATDAPVASQSSIAVTLTSAGSLRQQVAFLDAVQDGPRRALVSGSQVSVDGSSQVSSVDGDTTMTTQLTIFTAR